MSAPEVGPAGEPLAGAARLYLALLPVGHLVVVPLGGTVGTAAALARGGLLAAGVVAEGAARLGGAQRARAPVLRVAVGRGLALLAAFGVWAALSGVWGYHPRYAAFKGAGYVALATGAWLLARSGAGWRRLVEAWLAGCAAALALLVIGALAPEGLAGRVLYAEGALRGFPVPRVSSPPWVPSCSRSWSRPGGWRRGSPRS